MYILDEPTASLDALAEKEIYEKLELDVVKFEKEEKISIFNLLNDEFKIDGRTQTFINAVKIYCKSVFDAIEECDTSLIRFAGK